MVLLIHIDHQTVSLYRPGAPATVLTGNDLLDGADVVPGWTVPVCDLFDR